MMKFIFFVLLTVFLFFSCQGVIMAEETDMGIDMPEQAAKEYVSRKYGYDIEGLTITDAMIGRVSAHVDISHEYVKERVTLRYNEFDRRWEVEESCPLDKF
ncbi:MAG: hypothetical protein WC300_02285 [Candidatus Omnitrophota bacterium]|jgi:hypothetical protein